MTADPSADPAVSLNASHVRNIFDTIANRYDLANHVLSFGVDFHWRNKAIRSVLPVGGCRVLDMCCGTGDLTFAFARAGAAEIVGCDFSPEMIRLAAAKEKRLRMQNRLSSVQITWRTADCTATGLDTQSFDIVSCAFGVRNLADLDAGLAEMHRVLRPGGQICIIEFSLPSNTLVRTAYLAYFRWIMPLLGGLITGRPAAYRYLYDSVRDWDRNTDLTTQLQKAGFRDIRTTPLTCGIAKLHLAARPPR